MRTKAKTAKVAIVIAASGVDETDLMAMIHDMLDGGSIQDLIYGRALDGDKKFKILSRPHEEVRADWLFSRGKPQDRVIWTWEVQQVNSAN